MVPLAIRRPLSGIPAGGKSNGMGNRLMTEMTDDIQNLLCLHAIAVRLTGSRYICDPPPDDTDEDYLILCPASEDMEALTEALQAKGFDWDHGAEYEGGEENTFNSYRRGKLNLLLTADTDFAKRHQVASDICKALNLLKKPHRIMVFQGVLYGNHYNPDGAAP